MGRPLYFEELLTTLRSASSNTSRDFEQNLYYELEQAKPKIFQLFDIPPRNPKEKQDIEAGVAKLHGSVAHFNNEFKSETLFLAQELDCSELFCAELIDDAAIMDKLGRRATAEMAVVRLHDERGSLLECLRYMLECAMDPSLMSPRLASIIQKFAFELVTSSSDLGAGKGKGRLAEKMLLEIDRLKTSIDKTQLSLLNAPTTTTATSFGDNILRVRVECLRQERRLLGHILYLLSGARTLDRSSVVRMVRWLTTTDSSDDLVYYLLTATFAALDPTPDMEAQDPASLLSDRELMVQMHQTLEQTQWKVPQLKAAVNLQWSLWVLEVRGQDTLLTGDIRPIEEDVEKVLLAGIRGDAFQFLTKLVTRAKNPTDDSEVLAGDLGPLTDPDGDSPIQDDFRPYFLGRLDILVQSLIVKMARVLRTIRTKEDDVEFAASRSLRLSTTTPLDTARRNDTEAFFRLVAEIYAELPPDSGLKYWTEESPELEPLPGFLQWAADAKRPDLTIALYEMLASLARGANCAAQAFNFLATNGGQYVGQPSTLGSCSWSTLFNALQSTSEGLLKARAPQVQIQNGSQFGRRTVTHSVIPAGALQPEEVRLLRSFLRLLRNVVRYSIPVREVIRDHQEFNALQTLFTIVSFPVPLELKAALYQTLAAFCGTDGSVKGAETVRTMWNLLDRSEIVRLSNVTGLAGGAVVELEQIETPAKTYPATVAFVELLNSLIYSPRRRGGTPYAIESDFYSIPENLGAPRRRPGLGPYIDFVVEDVVLKTGQRDFNTQTERFKMVDGSLHFIIKCLDAYDLTPLRSLDAASLGASQVASSTLASLITHPGYEILSRLLISESPLRTELFSYISLGYDAIVQQKARTRFFNLVVRRVLQIIFRVLEIQGLFIDLLLPLLSQSSIIPGVGAPIVPRGVTPLEQYLIWSPDIVPDIAMYINVVDDQQIMLLAVNILSLISDSPTFNIVDSSLPGLSKRMNRLLVLLERHPKTPSIREGFVRVLQTDAELSERALDDAIVQDELAEDETSEENLYWALRGSIMGLLLRHTTPGRVAPNIAHLLLGIPFRTSPSEMTIPDPESLGGSTSCLHTILDIVNAGVPRLKAGGGYELERSTSANVLPLFERDVLFAEQCYRLIYNLCVSDFTSVATLRYLRTREDFFARHLAFLPSKIPATAVTGGRITYSDRDEVFSTSKVVSAFLRLRTSLLECIAVELHVLTEAKQPQRITHLLELLFSITSQQMHPSSSLDSVFLNAGTIAQPLIRILEIFEALDFEWTDAIVPASAPLRFYREDQFGGCQEIDDDGCTVFSVPLVVGVINTVKKQLQKQGGTNSDFQMQQMRDETRMVLQSCLAENHRRQITHAKSLSYASWRHVLDVTLYECFGRLPHGERETITLDLLHALVAFLLRTDSSQHVTSILAEVILSLSTKLREDRQHQLVLQSTIDDPFAAALPADRIHGIFRGLIQCVLRSSTSERFRGNIYASLTNFVHLINLASSDASPSTASRDSLLKSRPLSSIFDESSRALHSLALSATGITGKRPLLETGAINIINSFVDRFVPVVCRDAADGTEVWKTVAFTFLDSLVQLSRLEKAHRVLNVMARDGFLKNFVHSIKSSDPDLLAVLKPDPDNLNSLYVYEAKMSLLIRIAQTRQGADKLLDSRIFSLLSHCDFVDARPQNDHAFLDFDSFLPSAIEKYHHMVTPAIELAVSVVSAAGTAPVVVKQALDFVLAHRPAILLLLTDNVVPGTLSTLRQLQLLVSLCSFVVPSVDDLLAPVGFGAIHSAALALSARCISPRRWKESITTVNDQEQEESQTLAPGYGREVTDTIWSVKVDEAASSLQRWLAIYSMTVGEVKGDFKPVMAPAVVLSTEGETVSHVRSSVPTISDVIAALDDVLDKFVKVQNLVQAIASKLDAPERISADEIVEITDASYPELIEDLDINQRRVLATRELEKTSERGRREASDLLHWLEVLLLLLWRHLDYFLQSPHRTSDLSNQSPMLNTSRRLLASIMPQPSLKEQAAKLLIPILDDLNGLELVTGSENTPRRSFVHLICRRLRETLVVDGEMTL